MRDRRQRLIALCRLWGTVKLFHPWLADRPIDWDAALIAAIPAVNAAREERDFAEAAAAMLAVLDDPATCIIAPSASEGEAGEAPPPSARLGEGGILLVDMTNYRALEHRQAVTALLEAAQAELPKASAVIFDLRVRSVSGTEDWLAYMLEASLPQLLRSEGAVTPGRRAREHLGLASQSGIQNGYHSAFRVSDGQRFAQGETARRLPAIFIFDRRSLVPSLALALQDAGQAAIVAETGWSDARCVQRHRIELDDGVAAEIRLEELIRADGGAGAAANIEVPPLRPDRPDAGLDAATALARLFTPPPVNLQRAPLVAAPPQEAGYPDMPFPALEYRLLALFRIHIFAGYFFPYRALMDGDWDALLAAFIPRFEQAGDALAYNLAIAELLAHLGDSHVAMDGAALRAHLGEAAPEIRLRWIEDAAVIAEPPGDDEREAGAALGDIVLSVDGESIPARMARLAPLIAASTPQRHRFSMMRSLLRGPAGSQAHLVLRGAQGDKTVSLPRKPLAANTAPQRRSEVLRWLPGRIGYADLDRLELSQVEAMFAQFAEARAIIFDMRGYPNGTAWAIAPRLSARRQPPAARFERPRIFAPMPASGGVAWEPGRDVFIQCLPPPSGPVYAGPAVMLIDERAMSQAEHTGLFLKAANGTVLVGSATAGANGDVTSFLLPGGITVYMTGQAVLHPDGGQLQRVGLIPDVEAHPTIEGLREGRDEVLDAALAYLGSIMPAEG